MFRHHIRQRSSPTYQQTFNFYDQPIANKRPFPQCNCYINHTIIDHPITRQQTKQQKLHKSTLGIINVCPSVDRIKYENVSKDIKKKQMKGQLEEGGIGCFLKQFSDYNSGNCKGQLIPASCAFNHNCYGSVGMMNEFCNRGMVGFHRYLKNCYDFNCNNNQCQCCGKKYVFVEKEKGKNKKKIK